MFKTADLCDEFATELQIAEPVLRDFGGRVEFRGLIVTIKVDDDNTSVRALLETPGDGRVLVIDNGGSLRCALVGDQLGELACRNAWTGIIVNGCIRDSVELGRLPIGIKALAAMPLRSNKRAPGQLDQPVQFAGVTFSPGHYLYADADGMVVASRPLL
jgi:regulator of ribonuclease activity A